MCVHVCACMCAPLCWFMKNKNNRQFAVKIITELTLRRHVINIKCVSARYTQSSYRYRYRYCYSYNYTWLPRATATKANGALITRATHMWYVSMRYNDNATYTLHETRSWIFPSYSHLRTLSFSLPAPFYDRRPNLINPNSRKLPPVFFSCASFSPFIARFLWHFHSSFYGCVCFFWHLAPPPLIELPANYRFLPLSHQKLR